MTISTQIKPDQAVFAGIDYHKRFSIVTLGNKEGKMLSQERLENDEHQIRKFFLRHAPLTCAIENCRTNEWFVETVKKCGCDVKVSNTYRLRLIADSAKKNDKIDSKLLMELIARDYLPTCYQPTQQERLLRERLRWRVKLMKSRTKYKNMAHALMDKENKDNTVHSSKQRKNVASSKHLTEERQQRLEDNLEIIGFFDERLNKTDKELENLAKDNQDVIRLKTIPGVGTLSAFMLFAELGDITRFKSARHVGSYFGLVPRLYASSDTHYLGHITKRGSGLVRRLLVQDAWQAIKVSKVFRHRYSSILKRRGKKVAIIAIARRIAEIAYRILRDKTEFDETKLTLG